MGKGYGSLVTMHEGISYMQSHFVVFMIPDHGMHLLIYKTYFVTERYVHSQDITITNEPELKFIRSYSYVQDVNSRFMLHTSGSAVSWHIIKYESHLAEESRMQLQRHDMGRKMLSA